MSLLMGYWIGWIPALLLAAISAAVLVARRCPLRYQLLVSLGWPALWLLLYRLTDRVLRASGPVPRMDEGESTRLSELVFALMVNALAAVVIAAVLMTLQLIIRCVAVVAAYRTGMPLVLAVRSASR